MKVVRLKHEVDYVTYAHAFNSSQRYPIPDDYFEGQEVWVLKDDKGVMLGGFAIIDKVFPRTLEQLPIRELRVLYLNRVTELTGYFIRSKKGRLRLKVRFFWQCLKNRKKYFIYAYESRKKNLQKYYGYGDPIVLYDGYLDVKENVGQPQKERIELLTKMGILKILVKSTFKTLF